MIFRPTESSEKIVDFYRGYLTTTFSTNNEKYNQQLQDALSQEKAIADGPYISMTDPYEKGTNLVSLVEEGIVMINAKIQTVRELCIYIMLTHQKEVHTIEICTKILK